MADAHDREETNRGEDRRTLDWVAGAVLCAAVVLGVFFYGPEQFVRSVRIVLVALALAVYVGVVLAWVAGRRAVREVVCAILSGAMTRTIVGLVCGYLLAETPPTANAISETAILGCVIGAALIGGVLGRARNFTKVTIGEVMIWIAVISAALALFTTH